jgi:uncharacterized protein (TIGR04255 family)
MLPNKIDICPIIETVVEIRFTTSLFSNAVFGIIYNEFQKDYPTVEKLPILQMPEQLRDIDPNFKFKPHYKVSNGRFTIQIGPDVLAIGSVIPYVGWEEYSNQIFKFYDKLFKLNIISQVTRLGVRYVNFFETDIYANIKLALKIDNNEHSCNNTIIRTEIKENEFTNLIQIANNVTHIRDGKQLTGSIIDIDTFRDYSVFSFSVDYKKEVDTAHNSEKKLFFSLLKDEFIKSLKPIYNGSK